jgi:hypothetical protein
MTRPIDEEKIDSAVDTITVVVLSGTATACGWPKPDTITASLSRK